MIIAVSRVELGIPAAQSLKDKRQVLQSAIARARRRFPVSVAEVEAQDQRTIAVLGIAVVSNDGGYARDLLERVVRFLEAARLDAEVRSVDFDSFQAW